MPTFVALLRGINVGGRNRLPMATLRQVAEEAGFAGARTLLQSGNLVFEAKGSAGANETRLEAAVEEQLGVAIPVVVRSAAQWRRLLDANPFASEAAIDPAHVLVGLSKAAPSPGAVAALEAKAAGGERVALAGGGLWIHFASGIGRSRLTPSAIDAAVGSPTTMRNWTTAQGVLDLFRP